MFVNNMEKGESFIKRKDYTGQKFGHLVVDKMLYGYGTAGEAYCECSCDCGNKCIKAAYALNHPRNPPHCGCMTSYYKTIQARKGRKDLAGQRFGNLMVLRMEYIDNGKTSVICRCDCGRTIKRVATYLTSGDTTSCGCIQKKRASETNTKDFTGVISDYGVELLRQSHKNKRGVWLWVCKCGKCSKEFTALPAKILNGHITSCGCTRQSSGERFVENQLEKSGVNYVYEYTITDCRNVHPLRFDFYLPNLNAAIEYQGEQHYFPVECFGGEKQFALQQKLDEMKREYCKKKNITLLELPYTLTNEEIIKQITNIIYPERLSHPA